MKTSLREGTPYAAMVEAVAEALSSQGAAHDRDTNESAEIAVSALVDLGILVAADRWDHECHACDQRIGSHSVDGSCPAY
jgi:hypothetical protein